MISDDERKKWLREAFDIISDGVICCCKKCLLAGKRKIMASSTTNGSPSGGKRNRTGDIGLGTETNSDDHGIETIDTKRRCVGTKDESTAIDKDLLDSECDYKAVEEAIRLLLENPFDFSGASVQGSVVHYANHLNSLQGPSGNQVSLFNRIMKLWTNNVPDAADLEGDGLMTPIEPSNAAIRVMTILESLCRLQNQNHSSLDYQMSKILYLEGVGYDQRIEMSKAGVGMHPSSMRKVIKKDTEKYDEQLKEILSDTTKEFLLLIDDFAVVWSRGYPNAAGKFSHAVTLGNVGIKELITANSPALNYESGDDLGAYNSREFQRKPSVGLGGFHLLHHMISTVKGFDEVKRVLEEVMAKKDLGNYLERKKFMICAGDWAIYTNTWILQYTDGFDWMIAIPGIFHIGLNAQLALLKRYSSLISYLWCRVFNIPFHAQSLRPNRRKHLLTTLWCAWKYVAEDKFKELEKLMKYRSELKGNPNCVPIEWIAAKEFFENLLPLAVNVYDDLFAGDMQCGMDMMDDVYRMFMQLGSTNYVKLHVQFKRDIEYWKNNRPDAFDLLEKYWSKQLSEETIEIYHSVIRPFANLRKEGDEDAMCKRIKFMWANRKLIRPAGNVRKGRQKKQTQRALNFSEDSILLGSFDCVEKFGEAIMTYFESLLHIFESPEGLESEYSGQRKKWKTKTIPEFDDCMLPLCLQGNNWLPGGMNINIRNYKVNLIDERGIADIGVLDRESWGEKETELEAYVDGVLLAACRKRLREKAMEHHVANW